MRCHTPTRRKGTHQEKENRDIILTITLSRPEAQGDVGCTLILLGQTSHSTRALEKSIKSKQAHIHNNIKID